jgi:hypothetical protein
MNGRVKMPDTGPKQSLKAELVTLGYPWPDHLEGKSKAWLEAEIRAIKPVDARATNDRSARTS